MPSFPLATRVSQVPLPPPKMLWPLDPPHAPLASQSLTADPPLWSSPPLPQPTSWRRRVLAPTTISDSEASAPATAFEVPRIRAMQGSALWSMMIDAPVLSRTSLIRQPPTPITKPTTPRGISNVVSLGTAPRTELVGTRCCAEDDGRQSEAAQPPTVATPYTDYQAHNS